MPTLAKNVLLNGKVVLKGKNISAANVKKFELGDHLFESKVDSEPKASQEPKGDEDETPKE